MRSVKRRIRRPYLLLEVLVAFFLVALCAVPLIQPQFAMLKTEYSFVRGIALDRLVNRYYADLLVRFYRGEVPWLSVGTLEKPAVPESINDPALQALGFSGTYHIRIAPYANGRGEYSKGKDAAGIPHRHLLEIQYAFQAPGEDRPINYSFLLYVQTVSETTTNASPAAPAQPT